MKIAESNIIMHSSSRFESYHNISESLRFNSISIPQNLENAAILDISDRTNDFANNVNVSAATDNLEIEISDEDRNILLLLKKVLESITGKEVHIFLLNEDNDKNNYSPPAPALTSRPVSASSMEYTYNETYYEKQEMNFSSHGKVITEDGRVINFSLDLAMSREYHENTSINFRTGPEELVDPLVIHYKGNLPSLTAERYEFDITMDGRKELISFPGNGSGFLALDRNGDGIINDGSELFGPSTGNGFAELARYDEDNNNWIDENDSIFHKLRIWVKDSNGTDRLFSLPEKNIGAIYLGNTSTPFEIKDGQNNHYGTIQSTSIALKENGDPVAVQHIDLTI